MCLADIPETREVVTTAATAETPDDKPAICGTVTLHCLDEEDQVHLAMPMLDALVLLNSLRAIEEALGLQEWSAHIMRHSNELDEVAAELRLRYAQGPDARGRVLN